MQLFTIGYQQTTMAEFLTKLSGAGVQLLIDVRAVAASRRPGFSKSTLAASIRELGIDYVHLRTLGTPPDGRAAARAGRIDELRRIYGARLEEPEVVSALLELGELARVRPSAIMCFCAESTHCHRHMIGERLEGAEVIDL